MDIPFDNSYARLPDRFYTRQAATPVRAPKLIAVNDGLAADLGIDPAWLASEAGVQVLAGNTVPEGAEPLAQAYAGHQFGGFNPQLGDGRAILLGEVRGRDGRRRDIQLKGSGPTAYSRNGDGRAWLGPVLREYIVSEAMHALGIPTTRALAAVTTGEDVYRQSRLPGAVLTRVAASHLRVGTFQYFYARGDAEAVSKLVDYAIDRHYPDADGPTGFYRAVTEAQAKLVARWMGVGFIHGVMNTDNTAISGETIDYGPCAFMESYHPATVYSSIDHAGRYAYSKQADIAAWNLAQLGSCLVSVMGANEDAAIADLTTVLHSFPDLFRAAWLDVFRAKLGLATAEDGDADLIHGLLDRMTTLKADFTNTFRGLGDGTARHQFAEPEAFDTWAETYNARLARDGQSDAARKAMMDRANPAYIPRNHRVEQAIQAAVAGDFAPFHRLNTVLAHPFDDQPDHDDLRAPATRDEAVLQTFCGT